MSADAVVAATRLRRLVSTVVALGVVSLVAAVWQLPDVPRPELWQLAAATAVVVFGDVAVLHVRFGSDKMSFTWGEASIIIGLALVPGPLLVIAAMAAIAAAQVCLRRPLQKVAFNAAAMAVAANLASTVATTVAGEQGLRDLDRPLTWLALALAAAAFFAWNTAAVAFAIAFSQRLSWRSVLARQLPLLLLGLLGNTIGAIALLTTDWRGKTLAVVPAFIGLLYVSYRNYLRAIEERDIWQQLDDASKELTRLEEAEVASAAIRRAVQLFKAVRAEMVVYDDAGGGTRRYVGDSSAVDVAEVTDEGWWTAPEPDETRVVVDCDGLAGRIGRLCLDFERETRLSRREHQVLTTFAHAVSTCLQNARLYGEMRAEAGRQAYEASHDSLTGLANRALLRERAPHVLAESAKGGRPCALLLLDLDHFKEINDTLGHSAGDLLLQQVAERLSDSTRSGDLVVRLGGDEFAVLLRDLRAADDATKVAVDLLRSLSAPMVFEGLKLSVEGSIGVACYPEDGGDVEELLRRADIALYQAKGSRGSVQRYRSDRDDSSSDRLQLVTELGAALENDELILHFQPQIDIRTGDVRGCEALVRWQHPQRGLLPPVEFVEVAEHSGLVRAFTLHILDRAVAQAAEWQRTDRDVTVAVNLSARNLLDPDLPADVARVLDRHGVAPQMLVLEITETTMMSELDVVEQVLSGLRRLGVEIAVDDFGTGYSSLAFLQRVAVNEIKIDKRFVLGMQESESDTAIVRATIELAKSLGLRTVAEGVETADLLERLTRMGCDSAQGFYFGRPAEAAVIGATLPLRSKAPALVHTPDLPAFADF